MLPFAVVTVGRGKAAFEVVGIFIGGIALEGSTAVGCCCGATPGSDSSGGCKADGEMICSGIGKQKSGDGVLSLLLLVWTVF